MALFGKPRAGGFMDEIRCDEANYLIWKWHPRGSQLGNNNRENAVRLGSSLRVKDGEVAVFVYKQNNGTMQDFIEGPFDQILRTKNLPVLASFVGLAYEGGTPFPAEVYFINLSQMQQVRFGVPYFDVYDPRFIDFGVPVAVRGTVSFGIRNYREFVKLHRLNSYNLEDFQRQIRDVVSRYVKDAVSNAPTIHSIPVVQIENRTANINDLIELGLSQRIEKLFGVTVSSVDLGAIEIDKTSDGYRHLMSVTREITSVTVEAEAQARIKEIHDKQRIESVNYEETLRIQREEGQYAQHMQTQQMHIAAYQVGKQAEIGIAGAEALGQMGVNGAGTINVGDGGAGMGFNPAAMMASLTVGGVVGQNIAGAMSNALAGMNVTTPGAVPPPVPATAYHVVMNGKASGPFDLATLTSMAITGQFTATSLVWRAGMADWTKAESVKELQTILGQAPPAIPKE